MKLRIAFALVLLSAPAIALEDAEIERGLALCRGYYHMTGTGPMSTWHDMVYDVDHKDLCKPIVEEDQARRSDAAKAERLKELKTLSDKLKASAATRTIGAM